MKKAQEENQKTNNNKEKDEEEEETEIYERWVENEEPENQFGEEDDEQERDKEDDVNVDEIDSGEEKIFKMGECCCRLSLTTMENKLNDEWYACIFLHNKSFGHYIG